MKEKLAIKGGSGLYNLSNHIKAKSIEINTPWGSPSDKIMKIEQEGKEVFFLARHGMNHTLQPSVINYRANIDALKQLDVTDIVSFSAVGSLRDDIKPGMFVIPDQFIDKTYKRNNTFFDDDIVCHDSMARPTSSSLMETCINALDKLNVKHQSEITYIAIEGPQFSSHAESKHYKSSGADVIGMTNMPEAKLAREAEMRYATIGMVTDYDCFKHEYLNVDVNKIVLTLKKNIEVAKNIIDLLIKTYETNICKNDPIQKCLDSAIITNISSARIETIKKLDNIMRRYKNDNK